MEIIKSPDPILKKVCTRVGLPLSQADRKVLDDMYRYVKDPDAHAVGLAAPQIGVSKCMFVMHYKASNGTLYNLKMVNPVLIKKPGRTYQVTGGEGCLSEPDVHVVIDRAYDVILSGYDDISKKIIHVHLSGFPAAIAQHEVDHLNGILLEDYIER